MLFNSYIFILLFLPLTLVGYFIINKFFYGKTGQAGLAWLFIMSLWFYGYEEPKYLILILASIFTNFVLTRGLTIIKKKASGTTFQCKLLLMVGLLFNFGLLFYFKYFNFFMDNIRHLEGKTWDALYIVLPLGISFFTFQQVSFLVDCYKAKKGISYRFFEYAAFVSFFPQLVAGPIVMHSELVPQLQDKQKKRIDYDNLSKGLYAFALGLAKKVLIADTLSKLVNVGYGDVMSLNGMSAWIVMLAYTLQIYFDFSGYCDMALGMADMFNIQLPINFDSPYKAKSVSEFWSRWHKTLTRFFTHYVYIPLGGNRKGKIRTYINTMFVFLLSGLWHGANWTFILWGGLHGLFMTLEKFLKDLGLRKPFPKGLHLIGDVLGRIYTFLFVNITWILFRSPSIHDAGIMIRRLGAGGTAINDNLIEVVDKLVEVRLLGRLGFNGIFDRFPYLALGLLLLVLLLGVFFLKNTQEKMQQERYGLKRSLLTIVLLVWCVVSLSDVSEFLYFNF